MSSPDDDSRASLHLAGWAAAGVFSELALVRVATTASGGIAYYGNMILLVGIVALASGTFVPRLARWAPLTPWALLLPLALADALTELNLIATSGAEFLWISAANVYPQAADADLQLALLGVCFAIVPALLLIGAAEGRAFLAHRDGVRPYLVAAVGGGAGGALFLLANRLAPSPLALTIIWAVVLTVMIFWTVAPSPLGRATTLLGVVALLSQGAVLDVGHQWSPYQRIDVVPRPDTGSVHVLTGGMYIMSISARPQREAPIEKRYQWGFLFPQLTRPDTRALVLGSGGGTADVRELLANGATSVTAVEIDQRFVELGLEWDPDRTYADPRVRIVNDDARAFVGYDDGEYDLIYMPFLDSQTNASQQARFRLDSFLYTVDGLEGVWRRAATDGTLVICFTSATPWMHARLFAVLARAAADADVRAYRHPQQAQVLLVAHRGPLEGFTPEQRGYLDVTDDLRARVDDTVVPTDDWPFLYTPERAIPQPHLRLMLTVLLLMTTLLLLVGSSRKSAAAALPPSLSLYAWASGAAFFFIELRTIGELAPVLGSTYESQAFVVIGVLFSSVVGATLAALRPAPRAALAWIALAASLALAAAAGPLFHPLRGVLPATPGFVFTLLLPTGVAGYLYVVYVRGRSERVVLGMQRANLFGGAVGGLAEAVVVITGFDASILVAVAAYGLAFAAALVLPPPDADASDEAEAQLSTST